MTRKTRSEEFTSCIAPIAARYLAVKRALGRKAVSIEYHLRRLDRFLASHHFVELTRESLAHGASRCRPSIRIPDAAGCERYTTSACFAGVRTPPVLSRIPRSSRSFVRVHCHTFSRMTKSPGSLKRQMGCRPAGARLFIPRFPDSASFCYTRPACDAVRSYASLSVIMSLPNAS